MRRDRARDPGRPQPMTVEALAAHMPARGPVMLGVEGLSLTAADRARLADPRVGGVILFRRNFASSTQLRALTASIRELRANLLIGVDHEGGRVQRFRGDEFSSIPAMRSLGKQWDSDPPGASEAA